MALVLTAADQSGSRYQYAGTDLSPDWLRRDRLAEYAALTNLGLEPIATVLRRAAEPGAALDRVLIAVHVVARLQASLRRLPLLASA